MHAVNALVSAKQCLRAAASSELMLGDVGSAAQAQSVRLIEMGGGARMPLQPPAAARGGNLLLPDAASAKGGGGAAQVAAAVLPQSSSER